ncbi:MAG: S8 family serine peptidase [Planctomycetota bacterium]
MHTFAPAATLLACALSVTLAAQAPQQTSQTRSEPSLIRLQYGTFDPLVQEPEVPAALRSADEQSLWIVQFDGRPTQRGRDAVTAVGGQIHEYLPDNAYVVRMPAREAAAVRALASIRWVGRYHPAYRVDPQLGAAPIGPTRYNMIVVDKRTDKPALGRNVRAIGGVVDHEQPGSVLFTVTLTGPQLLSAASFDEVLWIDRWTPEENDMDNARIQGGGNYVEAQGGYTGTGVRAHVYEGIEATHPDFTGGAINVRSGGGADDHGHCTAGIVFGNGTSNPGARGMAPDAGKYYTQYGSVTAGVSRWQVVSDLVNINSVSHTTASWGNTQTTAYTSVSADTDNIIFDHDIAWTQSQSNLGTQSSRPQAWAKNVFSIGGVEHFNNSNPLDDSWLAGNASRGPAADGRIKPDFTAYYDEILTSDRSGPAGYTNLNFYSAFGGTSGATPIVAGHNVLAIQMFTNGPTSGFGIFGNALRNPGGSSFSNRPHFTTLKALQAASARQYAFTSTSTDNRREHQGWGFPNLRTMWDNRNKTYIVDETDVLVQGDGRGFDITVAPGEPELRVVLNYSDPFANPAAAKTLINNISVRVTSPGGTIYWGNNGLWDGNWSVPGGVEDDTNPIECVFVQSPQAGVWKVDIKATLIAVDSHVETPAVDADYALVVSGGTGQPGAPPAFASFQTFGQGCPGSVVVSPFCAELNPTGGTLTSQTRPWEFCYTVPNIGTIQIVSFELYTQSLSGTQTVPARIYASAGTDPAATPLVSTTITVGSNPGFYTVMLPTPLTVTGTFYLGMDSSAQNVVLCDVNAGATGTAFDRSGITGGWTLSTFLQHPSYHVTCSSGPVLATPALANQGLPFLGASFDVTMSGALPFTIALMATGLSDTFFQGSPLPLPFPLPGAPGCNILVSPDLVDIVITTSTGTGIRTFVVPNSSSIAGILLFHQWAVLDAVNPIGIVLSNAGRGRIGT